MKSVGKDDDRWRDVRLAFELDPKFVHLVGFWLSSHPRPVREAIARYRQELDVNPYLFVAANEKRLEARVRAALGRFLDGKEDWFALTESTSAGLALIMAGLAGSVEDEILTTQHEHYSAWMCAEELSARSGMRLKRISLYEDSEGITEEGLCGRLLAGLSQKTRIVVLTWVHSSTGVRLPIERLCAEIRKNAGSRGSPIIVIDATHAVGAFPLSLAMTACDIVVGSCHKWMLGPRGTAFIWGRPPALESVRLIAPSFAPGALGAFKGERMGTLTPGERLTPGGFHCFEHRWAVPASIEFLESLGGVDTVGTRVAHLSSMLRKGLESIQNVRLVTPRAPTLSAGFVCFEVQNRSAESVCEALLAHRVLCSAGPYARPFCRFTPFVYNSEDDIAVAIEAVRRVAREERRPDQG